MREASLRRRLARLVAAQVLEDGAEGHLRGGGSLAHAYNAALKRALGGRSGMGEPELEAACEWLGRHRLSDHLHLLEGDARFAWALRRRGVSAPGFFGAEVPGKP